MDGSLQQIAKTTTKIPLSLHKGGSGSANPHFLSHALSFFRTHTSGAYSLAPAVVGGLRGHRCSMARGMKRRSGHVFSLTVMGEVEDVWGGWWEDSILRIEISKVIWM
jgi:hypothetical protein